MKPRHAWHHTPFGQFMLFIGGLRFAVPIMVFIAIALGVGTFIDSTQGAKTAMRIVYGSGWFISLMALVSICLVAAVMTRYPWKRKHIGFITVHAGLILLIAGGFWSLFGRIEGQLKLGEGMSGGQIELNSQRLELLEPKVNEDGKMEFVVLDSTSAEDNVMGKVDLGDFDIEIIEHWGNVTEERYVSDDGPEPLRAVEIAMHSGEGVWVGEEAKSGGPTSMHGITVRVLAPGESWTPPAATVDEQEDQGYAFVIGQERFPLGGVGDVAVPGWMIVSIHEYKSAMVGAEGLTENPTGAPNPAVEVTITDAQGSTERHTAFEQFPDMVLVRPIEGTAKSGAEFAAATPTGGETLVVYGDLPALRVGFVAPDGSVEQVEHDGSMPWTFNVGGHEVTIRQHATRAHVASRFIEAPPAESFRPAILVKIDGAEPVPLPWKGPMALEVPGHNMMLRYGPGIVDLPFSVHLAEFRKTDYPGTMMAMAYESDVVVTLPDESEKELTIFMNNPYVQDSWKVYQSGFVGDNVSIFSVMRDPGIPLTYLGCVVLCVGILLTFYARALSWGHPGIPVPGFGKE